MRKVFWDNPYQQTLTTTVSQVDGNELLFEETIAYSFSGGQESDKAWINDLPVIDSRKEGNLIYYTLPERQRKASHLVLEHDKPLGALLIGLLPQ